ncbi:glycosyltransferase [Microbacterium sp. QXD-8]|uniref:Glycosyltransferase n=1 Tax=Microbacterium psychrotolerans TaxID=3068321 RepID=A0ABU0YZQ5_9MICO|nr:glycosyltransferase [Microbacterium sp. QXD-8]MDQ7877016.1 glycosyltransferase [Microbacterium sp. QXD-8]
MSDAALFAALPCRRQLAVTWGIPDRYGGMTAALLHRSRLFARAGATVDVVTFDPRPDYPAVRALLEERGELAGGVGLRNIYEDFRAGIRTSRTPPSGRAATDFTGRPPDDVDTAATGSTRRWIDDGVVTRVEHLRVDGSLAVLEELPHPDAPTRAVTAFDAHGRPTASWPSLRRFRFAWLDAVIAGEPTVAVVDSKVAARSLQHYRRAHVTRIHLVHGAHHDGAGRLTASRRELFEHLDRWDAVGFLTERQQAAAIAQLGDTGGLHVVHNAVTVPERMPELPPDRLHGVIACRLSSLKRVDHALEVIVRVRAGGVPVTAEIVGDGPARPRLEKEAVRLGLADAVRFSGYLPNAAGHFARGAWTLLTSRSEGESLSLLEAMGSGCVPVAYDIPYGPAEVIRSGRTGHLVPDGDIDAAAAALTALCGLGDDAYAAVRRNARRVAQGYSDEAVLARWAEVQQAAVDRHAETERRTRRSILRRAVGRAVRVSRGAVRALRGSTPHRR